MFLKKLPNSQDCTCAKVWHRHFIGNFLKFSRTPFLQNTSGQLLLVKIREYVEKDLCFWWRFVNMLKKIYCYRKLTFEFFNILKESYYVLATWLNYTELKKVFSMYHKNRVIVVSLVSRKKFDIFETNSRKFSLKFWDFWVLSWKVYHSNNNHNKEEREG